MKNATLFSSNEPIIAHVFYIGNKMVITSYCDEISFEKLKDAVDKQVRKYGCRVVESGEVIYRYDWETGRCPNLPSCSHRIREA